MPLPYPPARKEDLVEDYHGTPVPDPYRWLEDPQTAESQAFTAAQNTLTQSYLADYADREKIAARLTELWNYPQYGDVTKKGDRYFFTRNDGLQNQPVLYMQEGLDGEPSPLLDPNALSEGGTVALMTQSYTHDGSLLAYGLSTSGSDWQEIRIRDTATGQDYAETLEWTRFTGIAWKSDKSGFFYNRLREPGTVSEEDRYNYRQIYWHTLDTPQSEDLLVYERPDAKELSFYPEMDDEGDTLLLWVSVGTDHRNGLYYRRLDDDGDFTRLLEVGEARYDYLGNLGSIFYFLTDLDAPRMRIIAIDIQNPARENWQTLVPEGEDTMDYAAFINRQFVVVYKHHAHHQVKIYNPDGRYDKQIELPTLGAVRGSLGGNPLQGGRDDDELFLLFTSFIVPPSLLRYDFSTGDLAPFQKVDIDFQVDAYETTQVFYPSKDGTQIPMFLTHKKGLEINSDTPVLLYGYGGFNISMTPFFTLPRLVLLEQGWIYAVANLRGGDEYGEDWHQAGMLDRKQNVFDDYIAAAEWLVENGYTSIPKLVIEGRSNGGLLTAACMLQRPDLYGAVLCVVPVTDMLRYHKFTIGHYWTPEYGNAEENPDHFNFLYAYSPLHNVKVGETYPPIIITTADTDDRVVPAHAKKFVAALQAQAPSENANLIRIETEAGHGLGKPISKLIEENSDIYAFAFKTLGLRWK